MGTSWRMEAFRAGFGGGTNPHGRALRPKGAPRRWPDATEGCPARDFRSAYSRSFSRRRSAQARRFCSGWRRRKLGWKVHKAAAR